MRRFVAVLVFCFLVEGSTALAAVTGVVRGTVLVDGAPKSAVQVVLSDASGTAFRTTTNAKGGYVFTEVPFGEYSLVARDTGRSSQAVDLRVASNDVLTVDLSLGAVKVLGKTVISGRSGAAGAPVSQNVIGRAQLATLPTNNSLDRIIQTVPGVLRFSYNEPVAHGFHGVTYEVDGAPLPQATSSEFSEVVDPKSIDSVEIFTGAFPAEFGGSRQGAVVNIVTNRVNDLTRPSQGSLSAGFGDNGQALASLQEALRLGTSELFIDANTQHTGRGLDAPTFVPIHDDSSQSDQFLRFIVPMGNRGSVSLDVSNQLAQFEIPSNIQPDNPDDPETSAPGTDDVQLEYDRYASLNFNRISADGKGALQIIPWVRSTRVAYDGDLAKDILATQPDPDTGEPVNLVGLRQDRSATYVGARISQFRSSEHHAVKAGIDVSRENFEAHQLFATLGQPDVVENVSHAGTQIGAYVEDKWSPAQAVTFNYGVRYDHSTGFVGGWQLSPRLGVNLAPDDRNVIHFYYGRMYAAPQLEDVRQACVALQGCPTIPVYNLQPERDAYYEMGVAHTFSQAVNGYVNYFQRSAVNVLDTTNLLNTPVQAVFNNARGRVEGLEARLDARSARLDSWFFSGTISHAEASGVSGSTFLFPPDAVSDTSWQPEDHDQTYAANAAYTHHFGGKAALYGTLQGEYGTGFPVEFESGEGRLPAHFTFDLALGKQPGGDGDGSLGYDLRVDNLFNHQFIFKIANGFNTTQIASGRQVLFRVVAPF